LSRIFFIFFSSTYFPSVSMAAAVATAAVIYPRAAAAAKQSTGTKLRETVR
jgi:hypothetical protein